MKTTSHTRKTDLDLRQRTCSKADRLLNQYFVFVGRHESRHVAASLLLTYVFSLESTVTTSGGSGGTGGEGEIGESPVSLEKQNTRNVGRVVKFQSQKSFASEIE